MPFSRKESIHKCVRVVFTALLVKGRTTKGIINRIGTFLPWRKDWKRSTSHRYFYPTTSATTSAATSAHLQYYYILPVCVCCLDIEPCFLPNDISTPTVVSVPIIYSGRIPIIHHSCGHRLCEAEKTCAFILERHAPGINYMVTDCCGTEKTCVARQYLKIRN